MYQFRCQYCDLKNNGMPVMEIVNAEAAREAFQKFIRHRREEDWSIPEIFTRSSLKIICEDSSECYVIDSFGEIVKEREHFSIAG